MGKFRILFIGLITCFIFFNSCGKEQTHYLLIGDFNYINKLKDTVFIFREIYSDGPVISYTINPQDTLKLDTQGYGEKGSPPEYYAPGLQSDSLGVTINDSMCIVEFSRRGNVFHNMKKYRYEKLAENKYRFYFDIDSTVLQSAKICK